MSYTSIEEFPAYKALNLPLGLFGPIPIKPRQRQFWEYQKSSFLEERWRVSKAVLEEFQFLQDSQSTIGCYECEQTGKTVCGCACDACDSKYCDGNCSGDALYI